MEVKKILEKIRKQQEETEKFFAIQFEENEVRSALWTIEEKTATILKIGERQFWEKEEDLLLAVDASLPFPGEKEPSRVIFGITPEWIEEGQFVPQKQEILKKICREFALSAIGFVVIPEAIVYWLKIKEGIPPTAILVGVGRKKVDVILVKLGKIIKTEIVVRSGNLEADLIEGLSRFGEEETFPARIILYDNEEDLEEEKRQLSSFSWERLEANFLHLPKIESLPENTSLAAIVLAGGREIGEAEKVEFNLIQEEKEIISQESLPEIEEEKKAEAIGEEKPEEKTHEFEGEKIEETMGFVRGKDVTQASPLTKETVSSEEPKAFPPSSFGFIFAKFKGINLRGFFRIFVKIFGLIRRIFISLRNSFSGKIGHLIILILGFLFILWGIFLGVWWYLPKAQIVLWIKPQVLEKNFSIKLDPKLTVVDKEKLALPAKEISLTLKDKKSISTTGTKLVGQPAKGEVTIYNGVGIEKKFSAGTILTSASGLKFTLDEDVILASRSSAADPPPTKKAKVTAVNIGTEGNLAAGTEFTINNFSRTDFIAKNEEAFSGGTSREIQIVAKEDQQRLLEELTNELKTKATNELQLKVEEGRKMIEDSITSKIVSKTFDKNIEEEAEEITLTLEIKFAALTFSESEVKELAQEEILKALPEGFEYKEEESEMSFSIREINKERVAIIDTNFKAILFPRLDLEAVKRNLTGKRPEIAKAYLATLSSVDSFEIEIFPRFPSRLATLPRMIKNIKIEVRRKQ